MITSFFWDVALGGAAAILALAAIFFSLLLLGMIASVILEFLDDHPLRK